MSMLPAQTDPVQFSFFSQKKCRKTFINSETIGFSQLFNGMEKHTTQTKIFPETIMGETSEKLMQNTHHAIKNQGNRDEIVAAFYYRQEKISWSYFEENVVLSKDKKFFVSPIEKIMNSITKNITIGLRKVEMVVYDLNFQIKGYMLDDSSLDGRLGLNNDLFEFYEQSKRNMDVFTELIEGKEYSVKKFLKEKNLNYADVYKDINGFNYWEDSGVEELWNMFKNEHPFTLGEAFEPGVKESRQDSVYYQSVLANITERFPNAVEDDTKI